MKSYYDFLRLISDNIPYEIRRKNTTEWMVPTLLGVGFGVAAGVGIGVLLAPAPGSETRRQLKDGAYRMKDRALDVANKAKDRVAELGAAAQNGERSFMNDAR